MAVPAGPPIVLLFSLLAVVLGGRRSLPPLSSHSPLIVSLRMADHSLGIAKPAALWEHEINHILSCNSVGSLTKSSASDPRT